MRSGKAWTTKLWQRGEWRLGFNSVLATITHSCRNTTPCVGTAVSLPNFIPFPRTCPGELWIWYSIFEISAFAIRVLRAWWRKRYPFYTFLFTRMMYMRHTPGYLTLFFSCRNHLAFKHVIVEDRDNQVKIKLVWQMQFNNGCKIKKRKFK